jgi:transposase
MVKKYIVDLDEAEISQLRRRGAACR